MRKLLFFLILLSGCQTEHSSSKIQVLKGATVFDGNGLSIENGTIIISDGVIKEIGGSGIAIPKKSELIDLNGKFITPGLIDSHIHFAQTGFFDGRPDFLDVRDTINFDDLQNDIKNNPESYYEAYLRSGVTGVYDVGGFHWSIDRQLEAENNLNAPHVAASGPFLSGVPEAYLDYLNTSEAKQMVYLASPEIGRKAVKNHTELGSTGIKIWGVFLQDANFMESLGAVADEAFQQGNKLIVHATQLNQAKAALNLGAKILVHSVDDFEVDDEFIQMAKSNDIIYQPTLIAPKGYLMAYTSLQHQIVMEDPNGVMDKRAKNLLKSTTKFRKFADSAFVAARIELFENLVSTRDSIVSINLRKMYDNGIKIAVGTDAGNPFTFHGISIYDEMEAMQDAGIPARDLIIMATKNGALAMDRLDDFGTLERGKLADLIILDKDPSRSISNMRSISHVMRGGKLRPVNKSFGNDS
ncbi:amidohydrolase family protein [Flavobacteriaceae bacterium GF1]